MVSIENKQEVTLDLSALEHNAQKILAHLDYADFDLGIQLCDQPTMQQYNKRYRDKDKPTDILSFPYYPDLKAGEQIAPGSDDDKNLGDIVLCPDFINADLARWDQDFETRMKVLLVHGICHLLGHDHIEDADYAIMQEKENELLALI